VCIIRHHSVRANKGGGIDIYSNQVGPVQNNFVIGNVVDSNIGGGLSSGGYGHQPGKYASGNVFASNVITNNVAHDGGQVILFRVKSFCCSVLPADILWSFGLLEN
jgi:hypothetical protein